MVNEFNGYNRSTTKLYERIACFTPPQPLYLHVFLHLYEYIIHNTFSHKFTIINNDGDMVCEQNHRSCSWTAFSAEK